MLSNSLPSNVFESKISYFKHILKQTWYLLRQPYVCNKNNIHIYQVRAMYEITATRRLGIPYTIAWLTTLISCNWNFIDDVSLTCGNDSSGIGRFRNLHNGSHPCFTSNTNKLSSGTVCFTCSFQLLKNSTESSFPTAMVSKRP